VRGRVRSVCNGSSAQKTLINIIIFIIIIIIIITMLADNMPQCVSVMAAVRARVTRLYHHIEANITSGVVFHHI